MHEELTLFVEKACRLETSKYWSWLTSRRGASDIRAIESGDWLAHDGFDQDAFDAFCLNLRLLIQDQDGFSVRKVRNMAKSWPAEAEEFAQGVEKAAARLESELKKRAILQFADKEETTNKDLFDTIFYGGIAHCNPSKRRKFKELTESGFFSVFVFDAFTAILFLYRNCIQTMAYNVYQYQISEFYDGQRS